MKTKNDFDTRFKDLNDFINANNGLLPGVNNNDNDFEFLLNSWVQTYLKTKTTDSNEINKVKLQLLIKGKTLNNSTKSKKRILENINMLKNFLKETGKLPSVTRNTKLSKYSNKQTDKEAISNFIIYFKKNRDGYISDAQKTEIKHILNTPKKDIVAAPDSSFEKFFVEIQEFLKIKRRLPTHQDNVELYKQLNSYLNDPSKERKKKVKLLVDNFNRNNKKDYWMPSSGK